MRGRLCAAHIMRSGRMHDRGLIDRLIVELGVDRRLAREYHQRHICPHRGRERGRDLRDARATGHRGHAGVAGGAVVAHRHGAGTVLVAGMDHLHAVDLRHGGGPMHVAVAHQVEDACRRPRWRRPWPASRTSASCSLGSRHLLKATVSPCSPPARRHRRSPRSPTIRAPAWRCRRHRGRARPACKTWPCSPASSSGTSREPSASSAWRVKVPRAVVTRHARRPQAGIEPVDVGRRRDVNLGGERGKRRIAALRIVEMLELDRAEFQRQRHQVGEAELGAGKIVPAGLRMLGGDAVGLRCRRG